MRTPRSANPERGAPPAACVICGIPLDAEQFDDSSIQDVPRSGQTLVLARFELSPQYCGVLQYFAQYTDQWAKHPEEIQTLGLQWSLLANRHPIYPYIQLDRIVNPWGYGSYQVAIRLDEAATIELVVRNVGGAGAPITKVGGRIMGRYWYNAIYGDEA